MLVLALAENGLFEWLRNFAEYPLLIAAGIVLATFILEDGATIAAGLLAVNGIVDPFFALSALYVGIVAGDLGLYGLGRWAASHPRARLWIGERRLKKGQIYLNQRLVAALIGARCLPGMRFPTYTASGFLKVSFSKFTLIAVIAAGVWATVFFGLIWFFGSRVVEKVGEWIWLLGVILLLVAFILPQLWQKRINQVIGYKDDQAGDDAD